MPITEEEEEEEEEEKEEEEEEEEEEGLLFHSSHFLSHLAPSVLSQFDPCTNC